MDFYFVYFICSVLLCLLLGVSLFSLGGGGKLPCPFAFILCYSNILNDETFYDCVIVMPMIFLQAMVVMVAMAMVFVLTLCNVVISIVSTHIAYTFSTALNMYICKCFDKKTYF